MKFCCASNVAIKNVKITRKIIIFSKSTDLKNIRFLILDVLPVILFRSNSKAMNQLFPTIMLNSRKIMKITLTLNFETPLRLNLDHQSKKKSPQGVQLFFEKSHKRTRM